MAEVHTPARLAIPDSEYHIPGPGYHQKSIPFDASNFHLMKRFWSV